MKIISNREIALTSTDVRGINNNEMRQMHELNNRVKNVLKSHKEGSEKREYISDDDLKLMSAILSVFTKEYSNTQTSAFDDFLKEQDDYLVEYDKNKGFVRTPTKDRLPVEEP